MLGTRLWNVLCLVLGLSLASLRGWAQANPAREIDPMPHLTMWVDSSGIASVGQAAALERQGRFRPFDPKTPPAKLGLNRYWVCVDLRQIPLLKSSRNWLLEITFSQFETATFYWQNPEDGSWGQARSGAMVPRKDWIIENPYPVFRIPPTSYGDKVFLSLDIISIGILKMHIVNGSAFNRNSNNYALIHGMLAGALVLLLITHLVTGFQERKRIYLWFAGMVTCFMLLTLGMSGLAAQLFNREGLMWSSRLNTLLTAIILISQVEFFAAFYNIKAQVGFLRRTYRWFRPVLYLHLVVLLFLPFDWHVFPTLFVSQLHLIFNLLLLAWVWKHKQPAFWLFALALTVQILGNYGIIAPLYGLGTYDGVVIYFLPTSLMGIALCYAAALSAQLAQERNNLLEISNQANTRIIQVQRDVNSVLEKAVFQRTSQLEQLNRELTERSQRIRNLYLEQQKLAATLENARDLICISNLDFQVVYMNRQAMDFGGLVSKDSYLGLTLPAFRPADRAQDLVSELTQSLAQQEPWQGLYRHRNDKTGAIAWLDTNVFPIYEPESGTCIGYASVQRDLSEVMQAQERVRLNEQRMREIIHVIPDLLLIVNEKGTYREIYTNRPEFLVAEADEMIGRTFHDLLPVALADEGLYYIEQAIKTNKVQIFEYPLQARQGGMMWFEARMSHIATQEAHEQQVAIVSTNITARKEAQIALEYSQNNLASLIDSTTDFIWSVDRNYILLTINRTAAEDLSRYTGVPDIIPGTFILDIYEDSDRAYWKDIYDRGLAGESFSFLSAYGGQYFDNIIAPIRSTTEGITGVCIISRDVTERTLATESERIANEQIRQSREQLIQYSEELAIAYQRLEQTRMEVQELYEKERTNSEELQAAYLQLKAAQNQLVESEKMVSLGQLTAGIAHEINNPINFVSAGAASLDKIVRQLLRVVQAWDSIASPEDWQAREAELKKLKEEVHFSTLVETLPELLGDIKMGAQRTADIVRSLRYFARTDDVVFRPFDLIESLKTSLTLLRTRLREPLEIVQKLPEGELILEGNPGQLGQVFINLITNALDALDEHWGQHKGGRLEISVKSSDSKVFVYISDNGGGIPEDIVGRIFEPFFTTKPTGSGTGLGLSISYGIVKNHQGQLSVQSGVGQGTTFLIELPLQPSNHA